MCAVKCLTVAAAGAIALVGQPSGVDAIGVVQTTQSSPVQFSTSAISRTAAAHRFQDVIVAGGLDGRVYAINAWTGDTLWTFDSGGPMVDTANCWTPASSSSDQQQPQSTPTLHTHDCDENDATTERRRASVTTTTAATAAAPTDSDNETLDDVGDEHNAVIERRHASAAASTAVLAELVPSYDGRLYHLTKTRIKELELTMLDVISANGPVRLVDTGPDGESLSDIVLFGEKKTEIFALDAVNGLIESFYPRTAPFAASTAPVALSTAVLFGRTEFTTRAVDARNASSTRCFKVAEYFLQFAAQPQCSNVVDVALDTDRSNGIDGASNAAYVPPDILVLPKDPNAANDDDGSTIAAYDPWTNKQLWEVEIPHFDVLAVYGVSATRGTTFYQWTVDGPSSRAAGKHDDSAVKPAEVTTQATIASAAAAARASARRRQLPANEPSRRRLDDANARSKQLARVVSRKWGAIGSQHRLRLLGENYYLETSDASNAEGDSSNLMHSDEASTATTSFDDNHMDDLFDDSGFSRAHKRRVFWEPIENDGKRGVFITYYHVGAMLAGSVVAGLLLAWGCYVKGLSASIAHNALKSLDSGNNQQFFMPHVHQLTIERPGHETITISSVIGRQLLMTAAAALEDGAHALPLLENGDSGSGENMGSRRASGIDVDIDPATEAELMEKFARMAAMKAVSAMTGSTYAIDKTTLLELEYDASSADAGSAAEPSPTTSALVVRSRGASAVQASTNTRVLALPSSLDATDAAALNVSDDDVVVIEERVSVSIVEVDSRMSDGNDTSGQGIDASVADERELATRKQSIESSERSESSTWSSDTSSNGALNINSSGSETTSAALDASVQSSSALSSVSSSSASVDASLQQQLRKGSDASSSDSSHHTNEAEVLFPFVCQSRFANEFEEISAIGKGGFGQVILAENRLDGRKYAIKRVGLHLKNQTSKTLQKFLREVKILALLDHPNIVRYYQAWLEKVEDSVTGLFGAPSSVGSMDASSMTAGGGGVPDRNYSMSNLLAPITELEFSENQRSQMAFYSRSRGLDDDDDDDDNGFEWERDSSADADDGLVWHEEDLVQSNVSQRRHRRREVVAPNRDGFAKASAATEDDFALDKCDHWLFIQMQYCAGRNLGDYLALPNRSMKLSKLLKIFVQIASALAHVHSCGLIHRDLKPANIFVADTDGDSIKLGDFGLSRYAANVNLNGPTSSTIDDQPPQSQQSQVTAAVTTTTTATNVANGHQIYSSSVWSVSMSNISENEVTAGVGTYLYASPEQVAGKKYNAKTDVYSLGMILFELCHERFTTTMERYIALRNARDNTFPPEFRWNKQSPELMAMIAKLLSHDPAARPSADEVVKWGQELYELSLAQQSMSGLRSPMHTPRSTFGDTSLPSFDLMAAASQSSSSNGSPTAFAFHVEARAELSDSDSGERRVPNHNLLKEICDVIAHVGSDRVEIKKCGLQLQDGVQILEFVLDTLSSLSSTSGSAGAAVDEDTSESSCVLMYESIVTAIEALADVEQVRRVSE